MVKLTYSAQPKLKTHLNFGVFALSQLIQFQNLMSLIPNILQN